MSGHSKWKTNKGKKAVADAKARYAQLAADLATPPPAPRQIAAE